MNKSGQQWDSDALLFDVPFTATPARLDHPELGLSRVIALSGRSASVAAEVTLLDVSDHRLIRSGIELAHRVIDGRGDWYLRSRDWQPSLDGERVIPIAHGDLPDELADLVMPFRRLGTIGPVAAMSYERQSFEFRGERADQPLGWLRDSRVTVRRGGVTTARYREIVIEPGPAGFSAEQREWLSESLIAAGGTLVAKFPDLATRIGTPATGLTDYPEPRPVEPSSSFENFVESVLARRLRELIRADLAARGGDPAAAARLLTIADDLRAELTGLTTTLDVDWQEELTEELSWLHSALADTGGDIDRVRSVLRRERYLRLIDVLVTGVRGPKVDEELAEESSAETLAWLLSQALDRLLEAAGRLAPDSSSEAWADTARLADAVLRLERMSRDVLPKRSRRTAKRLRPVIRQLVAAQHAARAATELQRQARFATPADAFELGRDYQRQQQRRAEAQQEFFENWVTLSRKLAQ